MIGVFASILPVRKPRAERAPRHESDAEFFAIEAESPAPGSRVHSEYSLWIAATGCTAWARRIVAAAGFGQAEMPDLAGRDQVLDRPGDVLDRHFGIDPVLVEQIDMVHAQAPERRLDNMADMVRPAVETAEAGAGGLVDVEAELGGDRRPFRGIGAKASPSKTSLVQGP